MHNLLNEINLHTQFVVWLSFFEKISLWRYFWLYCWAREILTCTPALVLVIGALEEI